MADSNLLLAAVSGLMAQRHKLVYHMLSTAFRAILQAQAVL
jgi:hypothetical protein